ncbi:MULTISPECIES: glutathione S-transferase family protein [unclassified Pseudoalteromonas]|uniref:glutathione S-transferase family protein n=1 Tax=unclassified Pseudoalteromonas TaxID=194690 RepID=UPI0018CF72E3|nr:MULTISPECIES: glutathione S-transferase family protein [unclassified Pseudoalteromonas]MBH0043300.1 glutathione S-transferase family protein [Pseudoalteromonas sp. SWXJZ10B]MBH0052395.1 glutathione S-transferase family protein [Pseudoalteromonas sp. SWYJZ19]
MITLHGFAASNYYNLVKHVLLHKRLPFKEHLVYGGSEELLAISPAGKVPAITTANGLNISESSVICDFIEESYPQTPLYPKGAGERAVVRQIMKIAELYFELPSRRFIPYVFSGNEVPEALKTEVRQVLTRGVTALSKLGKFSPWIAGEQFTMADIYVYYVNTIVSAFGSTQLDWDVLAQVPGMKEWSESMSQLAIAQSIEADRQANMADFMQKVKAQIQAVNAK